MEGIDLTTLVEMFSNPLLLVAFIGGVMKIIRDAFPAVSGKTTTMLVSVLVGAVTGLIGDAMGLLGYPQLVEMPSILGGIVYGALSAIGTFVGFNIVDAIFERKAKLDAKVVVVGDTPSVGK